MKGSMIAAITVTLLAPALSIEAAPPSASVRMTPAQVKTFKGWVGRDKKIRATYRQQKRRFKVGRKRLAAGAVFAPAIAVSAVIFGALVKAGQAQDPATLKRALEMIQYGGGPSLAATGAGMMLFSKQLARPIDRYRTALNEARLETLRSLAGQGRTIPAPLQALLR